MFSIILVSCPVLGALLLLSTDSLFKHRFIAIVVTAVTLLLSLYLLTKEHISYAEVFVLLTTLTMPSALLAGWDSLRSNSLIYYASMLILEACLIGVFISKDVISFYVCFEAALIPLFIIIGIFGGSGSQRASYLLFLYTLLGSLFILIGLLLLVLTTGSIYFDIILLSTSGQAHAA